MNGILEITEQRRKELVNISLGIHTYNLVEQKKPLYAKIRTVREKRPKSETRACKECSTLVYGKAQFCVDHRYVYLRSKDVV